MDNNLIFHDDNILARFFGRSSNFTDIPNPLFKEYNVTPVSASVSPKYATSSDIPWTKRGMSFRVKVT